MESFEKLSILLFVYFIFSQLTYSNNTGGFDYTNYSETGLLKLNNHCTSCDSICPSPNLVLNGDFSSTAKNFTTDLGCDCTCESGTFCIDDNARDKCNNALWKPIMAEDLSNYLIVDGAAGTIWSQDVNVVAGKVYEFSFAHYPNLSDGDPPTLDILVDGNVVLDDISAPDDDWMHFCASWTATSTGLITLEINQTASGFRDDFGIDDIRFATCTSPLVVSTIDDTNVCEGPGVRFLTSISGGTPGYICTWSPVTNLNLTDPCEPVFSSIVPGTYTYVVTLTDANGCTATDNVTVTVDMCCPETPTDCDACGNCFESDQGTNLVQNGDFSNPNLPFLTGLNQDCTCAPQSYCIDQNSRWKCQISSWKHVLAPACSGNYLIVDGYDFGSTGTVWSQLVSVSAGNIYNFSFATYPDLSDRPSPILSLWVGGVNIMSGITAPGDMWTPYCSDWTADLTGNVLIEIRQTGVGFGNDFGIDDIRFTECRSTAPVIDPTGNSPVCEMDKIRLYTNVIDYDSPIGSFIWEGPSDNYDSPVPDVENPTICDALHEEFQGFYCVTVTDANGCTDDGCVFINMIPNVTNAGTIGHDQYLCGPGQIPEKIIELTPPAGGNDYEYFWMCHRESSNFWEMIPDSDDPCYQPERAYETTHYVRCVRLPGCENTLESNIVTITVDDIAEACITGPTGVCPGDPVTFSALTSGCSGGDTYEWYFGSRATPMSSNSPVVSVVWNTPGIYYVYLTVTRGDCVSYAKMGLAVSELYCGDCIVILDQNELLFTETHDLVFESDFGTEFIQPELERKPQIENISVYPNPFTNELTINQKEVGTADLKIQILDIRGNIIQEQKAPRGDHLINLNTVTMPAGIYILKINRGKGDIFYERLIKH